jgi:hypothetical protein
MREATAGLCPQSNQILATRKWQNPAILHRAFDGVAAESATQVYYSVGHRVRSTDASNTSHKTRMFLALAQRCGSESHGEANHLGTWYNSNRIANMPRKGSGGQQARPVAQPTTT